MVKKKTSRRKRAKTPDVGPFTVLAATLTEQTPSRVNVLERQLADLSFKYAKVSTILGRLLHGFMKSANIEDTEHAIACLEAAEPDINLQKVIISDIEKIIFYEQHSIES